jgi:hypothetical protein
VDTEILIIIYGSVRKDDFRVVNKVRCLAFLQSSIVLLLIAKVNSPMVLLETTKEW